MAEPLFELIYLGADLAGDAQAKAAEALKILLSVDQEESERILASRQAFILRDRITEAEAKQLQGVLVKLGVRCNYKPCARNALNLEIVPIEDELTVKPVICPECGAQITPKPGFPSPEICPECGLVFAKYEQARREEAEREAIRRKLLLAQKTLEEEQAAQAEHEAEKQRRLDIEAEIRKQLGIPAALGSRPRLIGSATALFVIGLFSGLLGARLLAPSVDQPRAGLTPGLQGQAVALKALPNPDQSQARINAKPGLQLLDMVESINASHDALPASTANQTPDGKALASGRNRSQLGGMASTWPRSTGGLPVGTTLADGLGAIESLRLIVLEALDRGQQPEVTALLAEMRRRTDALPPDLQRIKALAWLGSLNAQAGQPRLGAQLINDGVQLTERLTSAAERASASAVLAAETIRIGEEAGGEQLLKVANREFSSIHETYLKLITTCDLAESYALAGQRGTALNLLDQVAQSASTVSDESARNRVFERLATTHARLADPNGSLSAMERISVPDRQDSALYSATRELVKAGHLLWAADLASHVRLPRFTSEIFALLGAAYAGRSDAAAESLRAFDEAERAVRLLADPLEKTRALAQLGQAYAWAGKTERTHQSFEAALTIARSINGVQKASALGAIAIAQVDALLLDKALTTANEIADPALKGKLQSQIDGARRVARIIKASPA